MAEIVQEAGIKVDADPFGYGIENPKVPVMGTEVPAGNDVTNTNLFEVDVSGPSTKRLWESSRLKIKKTLNNLQETTLVDLNTGRVRQTR